MTQTIETRPDTTADGGATGHFIELQAHLLEHYGVNATSLFVELAEPRMRAHVLDAGGGEPVKVTDPHDLPRRQAPRPPRHCARAARRHAARLGPSAIS